MYLQRTVVIAVLCLATDAFAEHPQPSTPAVTAAADPLNRTLPSIRFDDTRLRDAVEHLRDQTNLNIVVNWPRLRGGRVHDDAEIQLRLKDVPLRKCLTELCRVIPAADPSTRIAWVYDQGVITISTMDDLHSSAVTRVYDVTDIVTMQGNQEGLSKRMADLATLVTESVDPASWERSGGPATIKPWDKDRCLVVNQLPENHTQIGSMLDDLRQNSSLTIDVQVRMVEVALDHLPAGMRDALKQDKPFGWYPSDDQLADLLQRARTGANDALVNTPRMTIANGGTGHADVWTDASYVANIRATTRPSGPPAYQPEVSTVRSGLDVTVTPYVAKDRKSVRLIVKHEARRLLALNELTCKPVADAPETFTIQQPVTNQASFETAVSVDAGRTICLGERTLTAPDGTQRVLLLLVTPTIIDVAKLPRNSAPTR